MATNASHSIWEEGGGEGDIVYIQHRQWEDEDEYDCVCEGVVIT